MLLSLLYGIVLYFIVLFGIVFYSILFYSILFYSILFYSILFYSILFYFILFYSILFYFILFYSILFYSILFYSILFYSIYLYCVVLHWIDTAYFQFGGKYVIYHSDGKRLQTWHSTGNSFASKESMPVKQYSLKPLVITLLPTFSPLSKSGGFCFRSPAVMFTRYHVKPADHAFV